MALPAIIRLIGFQRVTITGLNELKEFFQTAPDEIFEDAKFVYVKSLINIQRRIQSNLSGSPMKSRSGALRDSIKYEITGNTLKTLIGSVYSRSPYARIHERGGKISARNKYMWLRSGPYMNIPTDNNRGANGKARITSSQLFASKGRVQGGAQGWGLYLGGTKMFHLARSVRIKPKLGAAKAAEAEVPTLLANLKQLLLEGQ
jgi:phage gpG-like protein